MSGVKTAGPGGRSSLSHRRFSSAASCLATFGRSSGNTEISRRTGSQGPGGDGQADSGFSEACSVEKEEKERQLNNSGGSGRGESKISWHGGRRSIDSEKEALRSPGTSFDLLERALEELRRQGTPRLNSWACSARHIHAWSDDSLCPALNLS